jgi:ADP-heptose:LPS heptosyltransferase
MRHADLARILVIRLGALGDFVQSFGPFAAIRAHHPGARITLLTTAPYATLARASPWFDAVAIDTRPALYQVPALLALARQLRGYDLVYDLQTSRRSTAYFWLAGRPAWSGIGAFRRFPHQDPDRNTQHTLDRQRGQLRDAGILHYPRPDLTWLTSRSSPDLPHPYALLVPGAAPTRPEKRWPAARYADLAHILHASGIAPVLVGGVAECELAAQITRQCGYVRNLAGQTDLLTLGALAHQAVLAVGNDTGPMHLAAAAGCRCVVLFGGASNPALTAPRAIDGTWSTVVRAPDLADLPVEKVAAALTSGPGTTLI